MNHNHRATKKSNGADTFETSKTNFQIWGPLFQRLGFKPRRFFSDSDAVYVSTSEGWFRLGLTKYSKQELNWLRNTLSYLEERSFKNWAAPWQKTVIWEEKAFCYLIQPWRLGGEYFQADDPASITRIAEILTSLYECGKGYGQASQMEVSRNLWRNLEVGWETSIQKLESIKIEDFHEKVRDELSDLRKEALASFNDMVKSWRTSGIHSVFEAHRQTGIGHGNLSSRYLVWGDSDFYLLNWEYLAFQPRVRDLASLINDIAVWDPEWIIYLIAACARIQPFWPEEYQALMVLLKEPIGVFNLLETVKHSEFDRKNLKEVVKHLNKKTRCLEKVWYELGSEKRWPAPPVAYQQGYHSRELSMVLTPVETWGDFSGNADSLIKISDQQPNLPKEIMERLSFRDPEKTGSGGVVGGSTGNILGGSGVMPERSTEFGYNSAIYSPEIPGVSGFPKEVINGFETFEATNTPPVSPEVSREKFERVIPKACLGDLEPKSIIVEDEPTISAKIQPSAPIQSSVPIQPSAQAPPSAENLPPEIEPQKTPEMVRWAGFPKK